MNRKWMLAIAVALGVALIGTGSAASRTLYVGDTAKYSIAVKTEGSELYAMELAGRSHCYYTEPEENIGAGGFSLFPAPKLMREGRRGFVAGESFGDGFGRAEGHLLATLSGGRVTGRYYFDESEESFHCDTGFQERPFEAERFVPIGSPQAAAPARREKRTYYGSPGLTEIFLRTTATQVAGIRGTFVHSCPVGRRKHRPLNLPLFRAPALAKRDEEGNFRRRVVHRGRMRSGARFKEAISIEGRVEREKVTGTYLRVRTDEPSGRRCFTGPIHFRAERYLPVRNPS
jgi:hypothetical protein